MDWLWVEQFASSNPLIIAVMVGYAMGNLKEVRNFVYVLFGKMPRGSVPVCKQDFKELEGKVDDLCVKVVRIETLMEKEFRRD